MTCRFDHASKDHAASLSDDEWLVSLEKDPEFSGIDLRREYERFVSHIHENPSRKRFLGWLKNCGKPMKLNPHQPIKQPQPLVEPVGWREKVESIWNETPWPSIPRDSQGAIAKLFG